MRSIPGGRTVRKKIDGKKSCAVFWVLSSGFFHGYKADTVIILPKEKGRKASKQAMMRYVN